MSSDSTLVDGPFDIDALGSVTIVSRGADAYIRAAGLQSDLSLDANGTASISCVPAVVALSNLGPTQGRVDVYAGETGSIVQSVGPPVLGPRIEIAPTAITLAIGPPGVGASITLTAEGITLKMAETTYKLTATGITESMPLVSRQLGPQGHSLKAVESKIEVNAVGVNASAPLLQADASTCLKVKATLADVAVAGVKSERAGLNQIG